jgi:uncharacterized protein (DUF1015 family)
MSALHPFRALRPAPESADRVASVPYDVVSAAEAQALAAGNPLSFLRVTRAEIDLPPSLSPYDAAVYAQASRNFEALKREAPLLLEAEPSLYLYRLRMGGREHTGVAGCFSLEEYDAGLIKKHEKTRKDKEDDRTRHITELRAQTGVVFLTYRASEAVDRLAAQAAAQDPLYDFTAADEVSHTIWRLSAEAAQGMVQAFAGVPALYIADGHHRAASAARARDALAGRGDSGRFLAVAFPDNQVTILPYHRVVADLPGGSAESLLEALGGRLRVTPGSDPPARSGQVAMRLAGRWHLIELAKPSPATSRADALDVEQLQRQVLGPFLGIGDPRTDKRIEFVGGVRGTGELERLVETGRAAIAFAMHPVSIGDLMAIADAGGIMPPKSTWFEPKLRDGLLVHVI